MEAVMEFAHRNIASLRARLDAVALSLRVG